MTTPHIKASSTDVQKRFGYFYDEAMTHPIEVERNGAGRVTMLPTAEYRRLVLLDHVAVRAGDMTDEDYKAIRDARYPDGHQDLDALMDDT